MTRIKGGTSAAAGLTACLAIATLLLASCGPANSQADPSSTALEDQVVIAAPGGTYQDGLTSCTYKKFQEKTGVKVVHQAGVNADNLAKVRAQKKRPAIDVVQGTQALHDQGVTEDLFAVLDPKAVPNRARVAADLHPADDLGVTATGLVAGLEYNTEVFEEKGWDPPTSWKDLWDPKYKGHVALPTITAQYMQAFVALIAQLEGGDESDLDPGFAKLAKLRSQLYGVLGSPAQLDEAFQQGDVWLSVNNGARVLELKQADAPAEFVRPSEGTIFIPVIFDVVKDSPHPNAAQSLVDFLLSDDAQTCFVTAASYGVVADDIKVPEDVRPYVPTGAGDKNVEIDWDVLGKKFDEIVERWNKEVEKK